MNEEYSSSDDEEEGDHPSGRNAEQFYYWDPVDDKYKGKNIHQGASKIALESNEEYSSSDGKEKSSKSKKHRSGTNEHQGYDSTGIRKESDDLGKNYKRQLSSSQGIYRRGKWSKFTSVKRYQGQKKRNIQKNGQDQPRNINKSDDTDPCGSQLYFSKEY